MHFVYLTIQPKTNIEGFKKYLTTLTCTFICIYEKYSLKRHTDKFAW